MAFIDTARMATGLIDRWLDYQAYYREIPGMSVGISVGDETVFSKGYGWANVADKVPATPQTLYRIAPHSKLFTASAIMRLMEAKQLRLDDTIAEHLPWFQSDSDKNLEHMTIRQLLSHSSGMNRDGQTAHWADDRFPDLDEIKAQTREGHSSFDVLEHWKYSNMAYTILGQVIESVTGEPYETAVKRLVVEPMGLKSTAPDIEADRLNDHATGYGIKLPRQEREPLAHVHANVMNSATGFSSNVEDLLTFYQHHLYGNEDFLPDRLKREMQRLQFEDGMSKWGLGFALVEFGRYKTAGHGGGYPGFITYSMLNQEHKVVVVVLTNALNQFPQEIAGGLLGLLGTLHKMEGILTEGDVDTARLDAISGFYSHRWGPSLYQRVGNRMMMLGGPATAFLQPGMVMLLGEQTDVDTFRWVKGPQNGPFGETSKAVEDADGITWHEGDTVLRPFAFDY